MTDLVTSEFSGRTILVTGASSGIGRGVAQDLSKRGARVVLGGRNTEGLAQTLAGMTGSAHVVQPFDLGCLEEAAEWVKGISQETGALDGVVHCAGVQMAVPIRGIGHRQFEESMRINVEAGLGLIKGFRLKGVHTVPGSVVLMASVLGFTGQPTQSIYCATKGAIIAMVKAAALETARDGIRVNALAPGIVETEMIDRVRATMTEEQFQHLKDAYPLGLGRVQDVANAVAFLLGDSARWITGTTLILDGGYSAK